MNSTLLGCVYEIVIFTSAWLQKFESHIPLFPRSYFKLSKSYWNSRLAFAVLFPLFPFQNSKGQISCKNLPAKTEVTVQDSQVLDIFILISKMKSIISEGSTSL